MPDAPEIVSSDPGLAAGAIAVGATCAILATFLLFPLIDRWVRPRFHLERGSAMIVLLLLSLLVGAVGGTIAFFALQTRQPETEEEAPSARHDAAAWRADGSTGSCLDPDPGLTEPDFL